MFLILKAIFMDLLTPYRHFLHWNFNKILTFLYSMSFAFVVLIPLFVSLLLIWYIDPIDWGNIWGGVFFDWERLDDALNPLMSKYWWVFLLEWLLIVGSVLIILIAWSYQTVILTWLYIGYFEKKEPPYFPWVFFDFKKIKRYFSACAWVLLLFPIGIILFFLYGIALILSFGGVSNVLEVMNNKSGGDPFSIILWLGVFALFLGLVYMLYRLIFIPVIIADSERYGHVDTGWKVVKQSFLLTQKWTGWKIIWGSILFWILFSPIVSLNHSQMVANLGYIWAGIAHILYYLWFGELYGMFLVSMYERIPHHTLKKKHLLHEPTQVEKEVEKVLEQSKKDEIV